MSSAQNGHRKSASTAEMAAATRAFGASAGDPLLRNPDQLARRLIPWSRRPSVAAKLPGARRAVRRMIERKVPGALVFETLRTRHMDTVLLSEVQAGTRQVVVLGAGLDSRAYRFVDQLAEAKVYEIDQASMSAIKRERVRRLGGHGADNVAYVAVDFETDDLGARLRAEGHDPSARTVAIWSGVAPYLTQEAIGATLAWFAGGNAPGSAIVFDHVYQEFIDGTMNGGGLDEIRRATQAAGEPLRSGIPAGGSSAYLARYGLELVQELTPTEAAALYAAPPGGSYAGPPVQDIGPFITARIPPNGSIGA